MSVLQQVPVKEQTLVNQTKDQVGTENVSNLIISVTFTVKCHEAFKQFIAFHFHLLLRCSYLT